MRANKRARGNCLNLKNGCWLITAHEADVLAVDKLHQLRPLDEAVRVGRRPAVGVAAAAGGVGLVRAGDVEPPVP